MSKINETAVYQEQDPQEIQEWVESLEYIIEKHGIERAQHIFEEMKAWATRQGHPFLMDSKTAYTNTIPSWKEVQFPGNRALEEKLANIMRWNAMMMVVRGNKKSDGIGGHISTYTSVANLFEMGLNHFFKAKTQDRVGDQIFYQAHACPGLYARAFLEGRLSEQHLENFRRELAEGGGLSSYPHPWLMPHFWEYPSVSMGLAPIMSIYQARFNRYLTNRGIKDVSEANVWVFVGDGESDEPETLGAIRFAGREKLDNLTFVVNCNLQRLDGPVYGNGKIIQELEGCYRGANWNVIKVIWDSHWNDLLAQDFDGLLVKRMGEVIDGEYQKLIVAPGAYIREHFFGTDPRLLKMVEHLSDEQLEQLGWAGHDIQKLYNAFKAAKEHKGQPTVILVKSVKGYKMGDAGEAMNIAHQQKKMAEEQMLKYRDRLQLPLTDKQVKNLEYYKPADNSPEIQYLRQRRDQLGGSMPKRDSFAKPLKTPELSFFDELLQGTEDRAVSTTMAFVRALTKLLGDKEIGQRVVPIIPDEARTFGMDALFRKVGIYSSVGQTYEPVDKENLMYYKEAKNGQILEEGINEAGAMASFIAAGTAHMAHDECMIPFYIYYSMFGFQRVGDLIWAAADCRTKGFLLGGTAGRTTLNGEGLQHQDGQSHIAALTVPNLKAYDPSFAYEIAVIVQDGLKRMYQDNEDIFYYMSLGNENYPMPAMPQGVEEGILKGMYRYHKSGKKASHKVHLLGSGSMMLSAIEAQKILEKKYDISADIWSVTSYKELRQDALFAERWNRLHPMESPKKSYLEQLLEGEQGIFVAASDNIKILSDGIARWIPSGLVSLGTDGFGRSESRENLRRFFEVDAEFMVIGTLHKLVEQGALEPKVLEQAIKDLNVDPDKANPVLA